MSPLWAETEVPIFDFRQKKDIASNWLKNCHIIRRFSLTWFSYPQAVSPSAQGRVICVLAQKKDQIWSVGADGLTVLFLLNLKEILLPLEWKFRQALEGNRIGALIFVLCDSDLIFLLRLFEQRNAQRGIQIWTLLPFGNNTNFSRFGEKKIRKIWAKSQVRKTTLEFYLQSVKVQLMSVSENSR